MVRFLSRDGSRKIASTTRRSLLVRVKKWGVQAWLHLGHSSKSQDYLNLRYLKIRYNGRPHLSRGWVAQVAKTLGSERHKALIALLIAKREAAGLTQTELAERLGEYQSFVARLESGQRRVDVVEFLELSQILDFDAFDVLRAISRTG